MALTTQFKVDLDTIQEMSGGKGHINHNHNLFNKEHKPNGYLCTNGYKLHFSHNSKKRLNKKPGHINEATRSDIQEGAGAIFFVKWKQNGF